MDYKWSTYIQTSEELYRSRSLRFHEGNKELWLNIFKIKEGMDVLEVGCGGGAFCHKLKTYIPHISITGLDFDSGHIKYALDKSRQLGIDCKFVNGDATQLPFSNNSFDVVYSYTVMEHIEPNIFLEEQYRTLKEGGRIVILSVRPELNINCNRLDAPCEEEIYLSEKLWQAYTEFEKGLSICQYPLKEEEFVPLLEKHKFKNINIDFLTVMSYAPDNHSISDEMAIESINVNRLFALNSIHKAYKISPHTLSNSEYLRVLELINKRYDKRINSYLNDEKLWDMNTSTVMAITGNK